MHTEIERKFLVSGEIDVITDNGLHIVQAYLCSAPERTVRLRISGDRAWITIKGKSTDNGLSRYEWEKEIAPEDAYELLSLCEPGVIDKTRHLIDYKGHRFEVDVFHGENEGLVTAEIELDSEEEEFEKPQWIGKEVSGDVRYYNSSLRTKPFKSW